MASSVLNTTARQYSATSDTLRLRLIAAVVLLLAWEFLGRSGFVLPEVLPPVSAVAAATLRLVTEAAFYTHLAVTVVEVVASITIALAAAVFVATLCVAVRFVRDGLAPILSYLAPTPKIIFFPIALGAFGVDSGSKIAIGALSAFFPLAVSIVSSISRIEPIYLDVGRSFKLNPWQMALKIYAPCLWSAILTGMRLGLGLAIIGVLLAETKLASKGLGFLAIQSYNAFRITDLHAVILVAFVLAGLLNWIITRAERKYRRG